MLATDGRQLYYVARLLMTPLDLLHSFIYDSTSRHYNLSSYNEFWPSDVFSRSGPLIFFFRMLAADWLTDCY
jgi:hypothetical protein